MRHTQYIEVLQYYQPIHTCVMDMYMYLYLQVYVPVLYIVISANRQNIESIHYTIQPQHTHAQVYCTRTCIHLHVHLHTKMFKAHISKLKW